MRLSPAIKHLKEQYEYAKTQSWIHNPLAWALYQVWKEAERGE